MRKKQLFIVVGIHFQVKEILLNICTLQNVNYLNALKFSKMKRTEFSFGWIHTVNDRLVFLCYFEDFTAAEAKQILRNEQSILPCLVIIYIPTYMCTVQWAKKWENNAKQNVGTSGQHLRQRGEQLPSLNCIFFQIFRLFVLYSLLYRQVIDVTNFEICMVENESHARLFDHFLNKELQMSSWVFFELVQLLNLSC